jgi:hypothetical protein
MDGAAGFQEMKKRAIAGTEAGEMRLWRTEKKASRLRGPGRWAENR